MKRTLQILLLVAMTISTLAGASNADYNAFLTLIATNCKSLIIGRDNIGQALLHSGMGVDVDNYHKFLSYTSRLYRGTLSEPEYRRSLTAFLGAGTYNSRSYDCIATQLATTRQRKK
jgi:hypothetical protein